MHATRLFYFLEQRILVNFALPIVGLLDVVRDVVGEIAPLHCFYVTRPAGPYCTPAIALPGLSLLVVEFVLPDDIKQLVSMVADALGCATLLVL